MNEINNSFKSNNNSTNNNYQPNNINTNNQLPNQNAVPNNNQYQFQNNDFNNTTNKKAKPHIIAIIVIVVCVLVYTTIMVIINIRGSQTVNKAFKPIIYLYPEEQVEVTVKLGKPENITCSYPKYDEKWTVVANPDGSLIDKGTNRELYSLYWEGEYTTPIQMNEGFVVKGEDSSEFLEEKLAILGLNEREAEEFIVYWLPILEKNEYNYIRFASMEEINESMPLNFSVEPNSLIRVWMQFKAVDKNYKVNEQVLENPERKGFVAVEWGGTEIK